MHEFLARSLGIVIALFVVTIMFNLGLDLTIRKIVEPLRDKRLFLMSLLANLVLIPLLAFALTGQAFARDPRLLVITTMMFALHVVLVVPVSLWLRRCSGSEACVSPSYPFPMPGA